MGHNGNLFTYRLRRVCIPFEAKNREQSTVCVLTYPIQFHTNSSWHYLMALKIILSSQVPAMAAFGRMGQFADYWPRHHSVTWLLPNFISYYATKFFSSVILNGLLLTPVPFSLLFPDLHLDFVKTTLLCSGYA